MNQKDGQVVKDSALVIADQIASNIPGLSLAWGLTKALHGSGMKLREKRALEWVEMVRDNPDIFTHVVIGSENFQDAFVFSFEKYISERNKSKRKIIRNIFRGYTQSDQHEEFELERMISLLSLIGLDSIKLLGLLKDLDTDKKRGAILSESFRDFLVNEANNNRVKYQVPPGQNVRELFADAETDLISVGILRTYNRPKLGGTNYHDYDLTKTGKELIGYIEI